MPDSFRVGASTTSTRSGSAGGQHPNLAGLDLVEELTVAGGAEGDLAAQHRRQQVTATVVGDEVDLLGVDADGLGELHRQQVVRAARHEPPPTAMRLGVGLPGRRPGR